MAAKKSTAKKSTWITKKGLAQMLKGGVIMDVVTPAEAKIAQEAGAVAVMALERVPSDIRRDGGVARMSDPDMIKGIQAAVSIPVMAKARIGHESEARILEALEFGPMVSMTHGRTTAERRAMAEYASNRFTFV